MAGRCGQLINSEFISRATSSTTAGTVSNMFLSSPISCEKILLPHCNTNTVADAATKRLIWSYDSPENPGYLKPNTRFSTKLSTTRTIYTTRNHGYSSSLQAINTESSVQTQASLESWAKTSECTTSEGLIPVIKKTTENGQVINIWIEDARKHLQIILNSREDDLLERLCVADRLERLGISRYFELEINDQCLQYVYRNWKDESGIGRASSSTVPDLDATAMAFRLLRTHGFDVKEDCFRQFYDDNHSFGVPTAHPVNAMLNLFRASQTMFPGENLLKAAKAFTQDFLQRHLESKDDQTLAGEVEYALTFPWYASLPRLELRTHLDIFLDSTPGVATEMVFNLAKADFNSCQALHRQELDHVMSWNASCGFQGLDFARQKTVECYFSAAATIFESDMAQARVVWAKSFVLLTVLDDYFDNCAHVEELGVFLHAVKMWDPALVNGLPDRARILFRGLYDTVNAIAEKAYVVQERDVSHHLRHYWERWLTVSLTEAEWAEAGYVPKFDEYMELAEIAIAMDICMSSALFFAGEILDEDLLGSHDYHHPLHLVCRVGRILNDLSGIERETLEGKKSSIHIYMREHPEVSETEAVAYLRELADMSMQQLTYELLRESALPRSCKKIHFGMARAVQTFWRDTDAYSTLTTGLSDSVNKVLFEPVTDIIQIRDSKGSIPTPKPSKLIPVGPVHTFVKSN